MQLKVVGCHGGVAPGRFTTSYLLGGRLAIDAGALAHRMEAQALEEITDIFLSHSHHDHLASLPSMVEYRIGASGRPLHLHGLDETLAAVRTHLFNDILWPDFARIPGPRGPIIEYHPIRPGRTEQSGPFALTPIPMHHTVPCVGYLVRFDTGRYSSAIMVGSDTGNPADLVRACRDTEGLAHVIVETSFPDRLADLARLAGHLCPSMLRDLLDEIPKTAQIAITHLKPEVGDEIRAELGRLPRAVTILEQDMELTW